LNAYGASTYSINREIEIKREQKELEVNLDLPADRLATLIGKTAPEFRSIKGWINSEPLKLANLRGKLVLLDFWGYWCSPCIAAMPNLMQLHEKFSKHDLIIIAVHDDSLGSIEELQQKLKDLSKERWSGQQISFAIALDGGGKTKIEGTDRSTRGATSAAYGVQTWPTSILIDRDGNVIKKFHSSNPDAIEELQHLLGKQFSNQSTKSKDIKKVTCTGKVINEQSRPIAGVKVTLSEMVYDEKTYKYAPKLLGEVHTRTDGAFSFNETVEDNQYRDGYIIAQKEGLALSFDNWSLHDGHKDIEIKLSQPKELAGIVVDEENVPVVDAKVSVSMLILGEGRGRKSLRGFMVSGLLTKNTDGAGKFGFTCIPTGATAEFIVKKESRATVSTYKHTLLAYRKLSFAEGQTNIKLVLPAEAKIEGVVVEKKSRKPVGGVSVRCTSGQELDSLRPKPLVSKEDGTFRFDALIATNYVVEHIQPEKKLPDWVADPREVITEAGVTKSNVTIELSKGACWRLR
jgi:thiol-disulfide isomerase/thioredoxin